MADVREKAPSAGVPITYTSGNEGLSAPVGTAVEPLRFGDVIRIVQVQEIAPGVEVTSVVDSKPVLAHPHPTASRRSPREIFASVNERFPQIMARLAE